MTRFSNRGETDRNTLKPDPDQSWRAGAWPFYREPELLTNVEGARARAGKVPSKRLTGAESTVFLEGAGPMTQEIIKLATRSREPVLFFTDLRAGSL